MSAVRPLDQAVQVWASGETAVPFVDCKPPKADHTFSNKIARLTGGRLLTACGRVIATTLRLRPPWS